MPEGPGMDSVTPQCNMLCENAVVKEQKDGWVCAYECVQRAAVERAEQTSFVPIIALNQGQLI